MHWLSHAVKCSGYANIKIETIWLEIEKPYVAEERAEASYASACHWTQTVSNVWKQAPNGRAHKKQCCTDENFNSKPSSMSNCEVIISETLTAGGLIDLMRGKAKHHCL